MECVITVESKNLRSSKDKTGPIRDFLKYNEILYRIVFNHVKDCDKCDPNSILQSYLSRRSYIKFDGRTTLSLIKLAFKYSSLPRFKPDQKIVNEFIWRGGIRSILTYSYRLSKEEVVKGMKVVCDVNHSDFMANRVKTRKVAELVKRETDNCRNWFVKYDDRYESLLFSCASFYDKNGYLSEFEKEIYDMADVHAVMSL